MTGLARFAPFEAKRQRLKRRRLPGLVLFRIVAWAIGLLALLVAPVPLFLAGYGALASVWTGLLLIAILAFAAVLRQINRQYNVEQHDTSLLEIGLRSSPAPRSSIPQSSPYSLRSSRR